MGFGLINYRWVFSAGRFLQSAVASGTWNPQLGGPVIRAFQLPPPGVPHVWNDAREPQRRKVELWARNCREFCRKWRLPLHFWVLLHAVNLRHGTDGFTSTPKEGALRIFSPEKSDGFGRVWTRELGYQRDYVILITFPQKQRLHERASMLRYTCIACLIHTCLCNKLSYKHEVVFLNTDTIFWLIWRLLKLKLSPTPFGCHQIRGLEL